MSPPKEITGFFYDEEKDRYFPIHLKAAYDKEKKLKEKSEKRIEETRPSDLYRFMKNGPVRFDTLKEKLSRIMVQEIIWPHQIQLDEDKLIYYRYTWEFGKYTLQRVHVESGQVLKEFQYECTDALLDFKVIENNLFEDGNVYVLIKGDPNSSEDIENNLDIIAPNFRRTDTVTIGPHGYNIANFKEQVLYVKPDHLGKYNIISLSFKGEGLESKPFDRFEFFCYQHGIDPVSTDVCNVYFRLKNVTKSSAKYIHYDKEHDKFLILTYHGVMYSVEPNGRDIIELFHVKDLFDDSESKFEDLMIQCEGKAICMAHKNGTDIIVVDWSNPRSVLKKFTFPKKLERFHISSDYNTLLVQFKS